MAVRARISPLPCPFALIPIVDGDRIVFSASHRHGSRLFNLFSYVVLVLLLPFLVIFVYMFMSNIPGFVFVGLLIIVLLIVMTVLRVLGKNAKNKFSELVIDECGVEERVVNRSVVVSYTKIDKAFCKLVIGPVRVRVQLSGFKDFDGVYVVMGQEVYGLFVGKITPQIRDRYFGYAISCGLPTESTEKRLEFYSDISL